MNTTHGRWIGALLCFLMLGITQAQEASKTPQSSFGISASDLQQNPSLLQKFIENAYKAGLKKVSIPPGSYRLGNSFQESCLYFDGLKNFEVDATGSTLIATDLKSRLVVLNNCDHVTLRGGTFTHEPVAFSQGTIDAIGADRQSLDVRITKGYPVNIDDADYFKDLPKIIGLFDAKTRDWVRGADDVWFVGIKRLGPDLFRFQLPKPLPPNYPIAPGNLAAWRGPFAQCLLLQSCQNMKIIGITIYHMGGFCVHEQGGEGGNYYEGCTILRGPAPEGAEAHDTPLFSSACDGFHSTSVRHGPTYENCSVEFNDDDGFAIHGYGALVTESQGNSIIVGHLDKGLAYRVGDSVRLYDENGALAGDATVKAVTPLPTYVCPQVPPKNYRLLSEAQKSRGLFFQQVTLDHAIPARFSWIAVDANALGDGFVIRNCKVHHNRWRGIFTRASHGLIENCVVDGPTGGGIVLTPEVEYWDEVDFTRNTIIRNNTIRDAGLWNLSLGALSISDWTSKGVVPFPGGHRDIVVEGNTFENNDGINVIVSSAQRVNFRANRFVEPMEHDKATAWGITPSKSLYWITESRDITIENNEIVRPGPFMAATVQSSKTTQNIVVK